MDGPQEEFITADASVVENEDDAKESSDSAPNSPTAGQSAPAEADQAQGKP